MNDKPEAPIAWIGIGWQAMLDVIADSVVASPLVKYKLDPWSSPVRRTRTSSAP
jgi:hypothetical protein